ncbi:hypothetical protein [Tissierella praeacuta]|uniref:hypothetical protein n=1 Tax=Tissierella praeacuta TaxID=43131 RepID=UPI003342A553
MNKFKSFLRMGVFVLALTILVFPTNIFANTQSIGESYYEVEKIGEVVTKYITVNEDQIFFDEEKAKENNENEEVIELGHLLKSVSDSYSIGVEESPTHMSAIGLPIWGNYCGPGYGGKNSTKPAKDVLDEGCRRHDNCYKWGRNNCNCNRELVRYIDEHKSEMSGNMARVAWAIRTYFNTIGSIGC